MSLHHAASLEAKVSPPALLCFQVPIRLHSADVPVSTSKTIVLTRRAKKQPLASGGHWLQTVTVCTVCLATWFMVNRRVPVTRSHGVGSSLLGHKSTHTIASPAQLFHAHLCDTGPCRTHCTYSFTHTYTSCPSSSSHAALSHTNLLRVILSPTPLSYRTLVTHNFFTHTTLSHGTLAYARLSHTSLSNTALLLKYARSILPTPQLLVVGPRPRRRRLPPSGRYVPWDWAGFVEAENT